jgi:Mg2+ and Co2+ transporter CorA
LPAGETRTLRIYVSQVSHRTNNVMKTLRMVSTVLLPASLIVAFFGTSFEGLPLYQPDDFWAMIVVILLTFGAALMWFRRRGWI